MGAVVATVPWSVVLIILPFLGAMGCFLWPKAVRSLGLATMFAVLLSVVGLAVRLITTGAYRHTVGGWGAPLGIELFADGLSLLMLAATAVVGFAISIYSTGYFQAKQLARFWPLWLFLLAALNALFLSADIFNLYVTLELTGLAAVALTALSGGRDALIAAMRYLLVTLLGSLSYLLGVVLIYHSFGSLDIAILSQRVASSPAVWSALGLMSAGLALKTALFPLHFWLPPAHSSAPAPVSAALSALVVKASFYILLRLWIEVFPTNRGAPGELFGLLGVAAILWGGIQALRATRLKLLIANSTVMQLGYLFLAFPLAIPAAWRGALYLLLSHAFAKAAMFLAAGNIMYFAGHDRIADLDRIAQRLPLTLAAFALAGVSIMGLPPSGGFVAKWLMIEASLNSGQWWWALAMILGSLLAAAYVFKVIGRAFTQAEVLHASKGVPAVMEWTALALALAAILLGLIAPWLLTWMEIGGPFPAVSAK
jgi:formate hydrogenlyase subunit 3/multisubunit Na+/H+ antiporter MnhD subunit